MDNLTKENVDLNVKHTQVNQKFRQLTSQFKVLEDNFEIAGIEKNQLIKENKHIELKLGEI